MILVLTLIFIAFFVQYPLLTVLFSFMVLFFVHCINPNCIPDFLDRKRNPLPEAKPEEKEYYHVRTTKDIQEENVKRYMKPGFEMNEEWQKATAYIHKVMEENRKKNEEELRNDPEWSEDPFARPRTKIRKRMGSR